MSDPMAYALPQDQQAEKAILGAILLDNGRLSDATDLLAPSDFFRAAHAHLFERMIAMADAHRPIDLLTLQDDLIRLGLLDAIGGASYITSLTDGMPRRSHVGQYARIVAEKSRLRRLIAGANRMLERAYAASDDAAAVLEDAERDILGLADQTLTTGFESMRTIASRGLDLIEQWHQNRQRVIGVPTGFTDLDDLTHGLQAGTLVVLGARPGVGKTSLAMNIAQHAAAAGKVIGVFSLEMPKEELFVRQLASEARIDGHRLKSGHLGERDWGRVSHAIGTLAESPIHVDETASIRAFEIRSRARRLKAEHGVDLLVIDYLQLMGTGGPERRRESNRALELGDITASLKVLAKELRIPILLLSQLNRDMEKRGNKPRLSDLKESGSIEQDADIVMFLYRPETPEHGEDEHVTDLIIAKHRAGPLGTIKLSWHDEQTRYDTYAPIDTYQDQRLPVGDR
jgi:replicative DNA helicase